MERIQSLAARNAVIALIVTLVIIGTVIYAVNWLDGQRVAELTNIESQLSTDTLSVDTQFALLESAPCADLASGDTLSQEVSDLGTRLSLTESRLGDTNPQVVELKKQYTLLEIRDYILTQQIAQECHVQPHVALYFYSNQPGTCADCDRASYALSYLTQTYPALRVYSFDYDLDLGALKTLIAMEKVQPNFPAFVIDGKPVYGFTSLADFEKNFPKDLFATSSAATSTATTSSRGK